MEPSEPRPPVEAEAENRRLEALIREESKLLRLARSRTALMSNEIAELRGVAEGKNSEEFRAEYDEIERNREVLVELRRQDQQIEDRISKYEEILHAIQEERGLKIPREQLQSYDREERALQD